MTTLLRDNIAELPDKSIEELREQRQELLIERLNIQESLMCADLDRKENLPIDEEWYIKATFANKAKGILIAAIDEELHKRVKPMDKENYAIFSTVFIQMAEKELADSKFKYLYEETRKEIDKRMSKVQE